MTKYRIEYFFSLPNYLNIGIIQTIHSNIDLTKSSFSMPKIILFQDNLESDLGELTCSTSPMSSVSTSLDSSFPTPPLHGSSNVIIQRGARRLSGKTGSGSSSLQPHSVDSGIGLYSPTTPITPKTSSSPSVSLSENSPEK